MNYLELYGDLLVWLATHPIQAIVFGLAEFSLLFFLYHKSNDNKILKIVFGLFFQPQNFVVNVTAMSLIGLELPKETATTKRIKRWRREAAQTKNPNKLTRWRLHVANTIGNITNIMDPGHY